MAIDIANLTLRAARDAMRRKDFSSVELVQAVLDAIAARDVRDAAHSMALHVDRDLGLRTDMLDFRGQTERATSLIDAGYDPDRIQA